MDPDQPETQKRCYAQNKNPDPGSIIKFNKYYEFDTSIILGKGSFGSVFEGKKITRDNKIKELQEEKVAVKVMHKTLEVRYFDKIISQERTLKQLNSNGVVKMIGIEIIAMNDGKRIAICMQFMDGTLQDILKQQYKGKPVPEPQATKILNAIVKAYQDIYHISESIKKNGGQDIIHCDLKPENIFYKIQNGVRVFKIGDLGPVLNETKLMKRGAFTEAYCSPQQSRHKRFTNKADVYAAGVIFFQMLNGRRKLPTQVPYPKEDIYCVDPDCKTLNQQITKQVLQKLDVSNLAIEFIINCLKKEERQRYCWQDIFNHQIFKETKKETPNSTIKEQKLEFDKLKCPIVLDQTVRHVKLTPDTNTYAWKEKFYRQDDANNNICICQVNDSTQWPFTANDLSEWLCSSDLPSDGELVFTIKVGKLSKENSMYRNGIPSSMIAIGVMESIKKAEKWTATVNHCVFLDLLNQKISKPNEQQTKQESINSSCQSTLPSLPCLIECYINREKSKFEWYYNKKKQAESSMPQSWRNGRALCAVVQLFRQDDFVEFM